METEKPTLNQISELKRLIQTDNRINAHFDTSNSYELLKDISLKQKRLINFLLLYGYYSKKTSRGISLYDVLESLNFKIIH